jgi:putative membrane protein
MSIIGKLAVGAIAALHAIFMLMEMFDWTNLAVRVAKIDSAVADATRAIGANQGLYNGFLAAGLVWAMIAPPVLARKLAFFFLGCVVVAGLFGGFTIAPPNWGLLIGQSLLAAIAMAVVWKYGR